MNAIRLINVLFSVGIIWVSSSYSMAGERIQPELLSVKKEIPRIGFKNLSPPYLEYNYFQGVQRFAFQFDATAFNLINAWWLAEASTLVYASENFVRSRFSAAGLSEVKFFENKSTQCYVASNGQFAIVAFRGSEIWKKNGQTDPQKAFADFKTNIDIRLADWERGGRVHRGFKEALEEVWPELQPYIEKLRARGCKIWITGHSLGGALATLCAGRYSDVQGVYTYGSPRVGDEAFKESFGKKIFRFVNDHDIVPSVPPWHPFVHVGELKYIDDSGNIRDDEPESEPPVNQPVDETYGRSNGLESKKNSFEGFVPAPFRDHVPLLYAIHIWNNVIESRR